jgi:hypothetical protein
MKRSEFKRIEPGTYGGYTVYLFGDYPQSSVNYGMLSKRYLEGYSTIDEAQAAHPDAEYDGCVVTVSKDPGPIAPRWFNEADTGECWDEDY